MSDDNDHSAPSSPLASEKLESRISAVTLYETSAQVARSAKTSVAQKGEITIEFTGLPANMDKESAQVSLKYHGDADCTLRGMTFDVEKPEDSALKASDADEELKKKREALEEAIENEQEEVQRLNDELQLLRTTKEAFGHDCFANAVKLREEDDSAVIHDVATWDRLVKNTINNEVTCITQKRELERQILAGNQKIADLTIQLSSLGGGRLSPPGPMPAPSPHHHRQMQAHPTPVVPRPVSNRKNVASIHLVTSAAIPELEIILTYVVKHGAGWTAEYDVRVNSETGDVSLTYNAVVTQSTEENWKDVQLTLSTARPTISGKAPELSPWRASLRPKVVARKKSASMFGGGARRSQVRDCAESLGLEEDAYDDGEEAYEEPAIEEATVTDASTGATSVSFTVPNTYTVENTSKAVRVTLKQLPLKGTFSFLARPKLAEKAFCQMKAINTSEFTLISGSANVFLDSQFISKTAVSRVAPMDSFKVSLGGDESIVVNYKKLKTLRSEEGNYFSGKKVKHHYQTLIVLKNRKQIPANISLEEQIPISEHHAVDVQLLKPAYEKDTEALKKSHDGVLTMTMKLNAGEERKIPVEFTVVHPLNEQLEGL